MQYTDSSLWSDASGYRSGREPREDFTHYEYSKGRDPRCFRTY